MRNLIWVHEDALSLTHPLFHQDREASAIFIWDNDYWQKMGVGLKRLVFIYETLCELPVEIIEGSIASVLSEREEQHIYVASTPNPLIHSIASEVGQRKKLIWCQPDPFVQVDSKKFYKRFFQFWNKAEKSIYIDHLKD